MLNIVEFLSLIAVIAACIIVPAMAAGSKYFNVAVTVCAVVVFGLIGIIAALGV